MNTLSNSLPFAGEPTADFRERLAREQAQAAERRQHALTEQASTLNTPQQRIRIWEQLHAIELPRSSAHRLIDIIAANTGLTVAQIREEQQQRATGRTVEPPVTPPAPGTAATG